MESDLLDIHDYEQDPAVLKERFEQFFVEDDPDYYKKGGYPYRGGPVMISETGGIGWTKEDGAWFYGDMPRTEEEFLTRFRGIRPSCRWTCLRILSGEPRPFWGRAAAMCCPSAARAADAWDKGERPWIETLTFPHWCSTA